MEESKFGISRLANWLESSRLPLMQYGGLLSRRRNVWLWLAGQTGLLWRQVSSELSSPSNSNIPQVWSFSPPEDVLYEAQPTHAQRMLNAPPRPLSAVEYRSTGTQDQPMSGLLSSGNDTQMQVAYASEKEDVDMLDPQPSTAPLQATGPTFFHDD
jgi:hypothetical protein